MTTEQEVDKFVKGRFKNLSACLFDNVVIIAFQMIFYAEMYANSVFYLFKIIFDISICDCFSNNFLCRNVC